MPQPDESWSEVGERFKNLGGLFKRHYEQQEKPGEAEEAVSEEEVKDAIKTLTDSLNRAFSSVGDALKDPDVKEEAKATARSFADALGSTFAAIGDEIRKLRKDQTEAEPPSRTEAAPAEPPPAEEQ